MNNKVMLEQAQAIKFSWPQLHQKLKLNLSGESGWDNFIEDIRWIEKTIEKLVNENADACLFVLVQMLHEKNLSYSASHALLCATLCKVMSKYTEHSPEELSSLCQAALTMNIGMSSLHDQLAHQKSEITATQTASIANHSEIGWQLLRSKGVQDEKWLEIVRNHHLDLEQAMHTSTHMLQLADIYVGSISPRSTRPGLLPRQGALRIYKGEEGKHNSLGPAFVKSIGIYIPGSYVKLTNGEISIVIKRGSNIHTPKVVSLIGIRGAPIKDPLLRDTSEPNFEIKEAIPTHKVRIRNNWEYLLNKFF